LLLRRATCRPIPAIILRKNTTTFLIGTFFVGDLCPPRHLALCIPMDQKATLGHPAKESLPHFLALTMSQLNTMSKAKSSCDSLRFIPQYYDNSDPHNSALNLILTLRPDWRESKDTIDFERFTDGITNTVCRPWSFSINRKFAWLIAWAAP
jgi:hypothetical protein